MTIAGTIVVSVLSINYPVPTGMLALIAEDGSTHVMVSRPFGDFCEIAHCESLTNAATVITNAQFRTDVAAQLGLVDGGSGSEIIAAKTKYAVPGTSFVWILGEFFNAAEGEYTIYGLRYSVVSPGVTRIDGKLHNRNDHSYDGIIGHGDALTSTWGGALGIAVDGTNALCVDAFGHFFANFRVKLLSLPLVGDAVDLSPNSWHARLSAMPAGNMTAMNGWWDRGPSNAGNWASVVPLSTGTGVFNYQNFHGSQPSEFIGTIITGVATNTGETDYASHFGMPFPDEGFDFAGNPSTSDFDFYNNPSINVLPDSRIEFVFMRRYSDREDWIGVRRIITHADLSNVDGAGLASFFFTTDLTAQGLEAGHAYRMGGDLLYMVREAKRLIFQQLATPIGEAEEAEYPDIDTTEEDDVDELPPADAAIVTQRWLMRTGHIREWGEIMIDDLRITIKRGVGDTEIEPCIYVRANRDNRSWTKPAKRGLGKKGDRTMTLTFGGFGSARDWQFEAWTTDNCEIELRKLEILPTPLGH